MKKPIIVKKNVRHTFSPDEVAGLNTEFRQAFSNLKAVECEFDNVKAVWKSKTTEAESRMETLNATLQAGFEMRQKECIVIFRIADKKKDFYLDVPASPFTLEARIEDGEKPVLTEDMLPEDFEQDLIQAEAAFDNRTELVLWEAGADKGILVIGSQGNRWFTAVRGSVGVNKLEDRLDSEQRSTKNRADAINLAGKRALEWLKTTLGKDAAKGFEDGIKAVVEGEKEKAE